jgi:hypothetical protein
VLLRLPYLASPAWSPSCGYYPWTAVGTVLSFESHYHEIVPDTRIVYSSALYAAETLATVSLTTVRVGTRHGVAPPALSSGATPCCACRSVLLAWLVESRCAVLKGPGRGLC